ncbi:MAG TPA: MbtH family NRPS accessory protein [Planctomycetaceae bacterium]|jgi:MbtH protein
MTNTNPFDDEVEFQILVNAEGQHSLWPALLEVPAGWVVIGPQGQRNVCLEWIDGNWTDMRPLSLRNATAGEVSLKS